MNTQELTHKITGKSVESVRSEISKKLSSRPYFANNETVTQVVTDMDHHPYMRWFRGVYYYPDPIVAEREAGWRQINNSCYDLVLPAEETHPEHCFEAACTTIFPCFPQSVAKYADQNAFDSVINRTCNVQYR